MGSLVLTLVILLLLSGFFSSSETGLMAINKYRLRHLANSGHRGARLAQKLLSRPDRLIGLILLGNNLVNIMAASIATVIGIRLFGANGVWIASLVLTVVVLIFSEVAPKTVAALHPERIAYPASYVLFVLMKFLSPVVVLVNMLANFVLKPFRVHTDAELIEQLNREELRTLVFGHWARAGLMVCEGLRGLEIRPSVPDQDRVGRCQTEPIGGGLEQRVGREFDHRIAPHEPVVVIEGLEVVEVDVGVRERNALLDATLELAVDVGDFKLGGSQRRQQREQRSGTPAAPAPGG